MKTQFKAVRCFQNNGPDYWIVTDKAFKGNILAQCDSEDQATLIARAVNGYDGLLEIAKEALCWLDPDCKLDGAAINENRSDKENVIIGLYEAIAKADLTSQTNVGK